jgi:DNA-directed RNA polymerase specialized sigma24 family protein
MPRPEKTNSRIENISTHVSIIDDPTRFVLRYGRAVRAYLGALVRDVNDADDVAQELLSRVLQRGLNWEGGSARSGGSSNRFRDYLKAILRNVAVDWYRSNMRDAVSGIDLDAVARSEINADKQWLADWRSCILKAAWTALEAHELQHPDNFCFNSLKLASEHAEESSAQLAARLSEKVGRPIRPDAFRKQLSRSRRLFAGLIVDEVSQSLVNPDPSEIEGELHALGLLEHVRRYRGGESAE